MSAVPAGSHVPLAALAELVQRALDATGAPIGWISFLEDGRERLQARIGVPFTELDASHSPLLCAGTAASFALADASQGAWRQHPLVAAGPRARFIAVVPLLDAGANVMGSLTVLDPQPRELKRTQGTALQNLASLAVARTAAMRAIPTPAGAVPSPAEDELSVERSLARALGEQVDGGFFVAGHDGVLLRWNSAFSKTLGIDAATAGIALPDLASAHARPGIERALREVVERGREVSLEAELVDRAGNVRPCSITGVPLRLGAQACMLGITRDVTLRRRAERQAARTRERLDLALASSRLALWDWDLATDRVYLNENWAALLGEEPRESTLASEALLAAAHAEDREVLRAALASAVRGASDEIDCEYRMRDRSGEWTWIQARGRVTQRDASGRALRMTGTATDVTKRKRAEERVEFLATRDPLTGLPNRVLLHDRLEQAVASAARRHAGFAFMFIDLDRFKTINDSLGHPVGDALLKAVAGRLEACVRATDTVARLGGDEFAVILENLGHDDGEGAQQVAANMIAAMAAPVLVNGQPLSTSCSIGIGLYPCDGRDSATLMKNADAAMYHAKEKGRNNFRFFSGEMNARAQERLAVESFLRLALRRGELVLHYQPRMRVASGELAGVEALIRWQHPRRGLLEPARFIDVAEDSGLIVPIGEWVIDTACEQLAAWQRTLQPALHLSVNLAVGQVADGDRLYRTVANALQRHGVRAATLELELTESHLMKDIEEKGVLLDRLGRLGVGLAIDDFGTGYSSLSYLKRLPVDSIKIDGSFVRDIGTDANDEAIVAAIVAMAHSLQLSVVAEGVETAAQLQALRELGCDEYQGFHESPALTAAEFERKYRR